MLSRVIAQNVGDVFLRHSVVLSLVFSPGLCNITYSVENMDAILQVMLYSLETFWHLSCGGRHDVKTGYVVYMTQTLYCYCKCYILSSSSSFSTFPYFSCVFSWALHGLIHCHFEKIKPSSAWPFDVMPSPTQPGTFSTYFKYMQLSKYVSVNKQFRQQAKVTFMVYITFFKITCFICEFWI